MAEIPNKPLKPINSEGTPAEHKNLGELYNTEKGRYDPLWRFLREKGVDPTAININLKYKTWGDIREAADGSATSSVEIFYNYHDLEDYRRSLPVDTKKKWDQISWGVDNPYTKIEVVAQNDFWKRFEDGGDLSQYNDELDRLLEQIKNEELPDEYADAVKRGEVKQLPHPLELRRILRRIDEQKVDGTENKTEKKDESPERLALDKNRAVYARAFANLKKSGVKLKDAEKIVADMDADTADRLALVKDLVLLKQIDNLTSEDIGRLEHHEIIEKLKSFEVSTKQTEEAMERRRTRELALQRKYPEMTEEQIAAILGLVVGKYVYQEARQDLFEEIYFEELKKKREEFEKDLGPYSSAWPEEKKEEVLNYANSVALEETVINERERLLAARAEAWPPQEKAVWRKVAEKGFDWWMKQGKWKRLAITSVVMTGVFGVTSGLGVVGVGAYAGSRIVKSIASMGAAQGVGKVYDLVSRKLGTDLESEEEEHAMDIEDLKVESQSGKLSLEEIEKRYNDLVEESKKNKRKHLILKGAIMMAAGMATTVSLNEVYHHMTAAAATATAGGTGLHEQQHGGSAGDDQQWHGDQDTGSDQDLTSNPYEGATAHGGVTLDPHQTASPQTDVTPASAAKHLDTAATPKGSPSPEASPLPSPKPTPDTETLHHDSPQTDTAPRSPWNIDKQLHQTSNPPSDHELGASKLHETTGSKPAADTAGSHNKPTVDAKPTDSAAVKTADISQVRKGEGAWQAVHRQLEQQAHANPEKFHLTQEDFQNNPSKVHAALNKETYETLIKNKFIDPKTGAEIRLSGPGAHVQVDEHGTISVKEGTSAEYHYQPSHASNTAHIETHHNVAPHVQAGIQDAGHPDHAATTIQSHPAAPIQSSPTTPPHSEPIPDAAPRPPQQVAHIDDTYHFRFDPNQEKLAHDLGFTNVTDAERMKSLKIGDFLRQIDKVKNDRDFIALQNGATNTGPEISVPNEMLLMPEIKIVLHPEHLKLAALLRQNISLKPDMSIDEAFHQLSEKQ